MIQHISRSTCEYSVSARFGVGAKPEQNLAGVMHIDIVIDDHYVFGKHHLPHSPKPVHDFVSLHRISFFDTDKYQIVKDPLGWKRNVNDFREIHFKHGQE